MTGKGFGRRLRTLGSTLAGRNGSVSRAMTSSNLSLILFTARGVFVALAWRLIMFFEPLQFFIGSYYPINNTNPPRNPR